MKILIVEDEEALSSGLRFNFEQEGYEAIVAGDGRTALEQLHSADPAFDLVVLDLMLPGMSGYETCRFIREFNTQIPVLVLSARTLAEDKALAFDCGTDQYMTKPFALGELLSRVRNLLERRHPSSAAGSSNGSRPPESYRFGGVSVDFSKFELRVDGQLHSLTKMELDLLRFFIENEGHVLSRGEILEHVWGLDANVASRSIDNFVLRLRKLIESNPAEPQHILSVRGTGYRFVSRPSSPTADQGPV